MFIVDNNKTRPFNPICFLFLFFLPQRSHWHSVAISHKHPTYMIAIHHPYSPQIGEVNSPFPFNNLSNNPSTKWHPLTPAPHLASLPDLSPSLYHPTNQTMEVCRSLHLCRFQLCYLYHYTTLFVSCYAGPMSPPSYRRNQRVEIVGGESGMLGSFYEATLVRKLDPNHWEVEYVTLLRNNRRELLREVLPVQRIRPRPPRISYDAYMPEDRVDCRDNDGFWAGRVLGVSGYGSDRTFTVYFPLSDETSDHRARNMRPHFDWDGYRFTTQPQFQGLLP